MPSRRRLPLALATVALVAGALSCGSPTEPTLVPKVLRVVGAPVDTGVAGTTLARQFTVELLADGDRPVAGRVVRFETIAGASTLSSSSVTTDVNGRASVAVTLGPRVGGSRIGANAGGLSADLQLWARPGPPAKLLTPGPVTVRDTVGRHASQPFSVWLADQYDNAIPDGVITWSVLAGLGTLDSATSRTNQTGDVRVGYTMGPRVRVDTIVAQATGTSGPLTLQFYAVSIPAGAASIEVIAGGGQTVSAAALAPVAPSVKLLDTAGAPVVDAPVRFVSSRPDTVTITSGLDGVAAVPSWRVSWRAGPDSMVATYGIVRAVFGATVTPGAAARLVATAPLSDSAQSGRTLAQPLRLAVADSFTNLVPGASASVDVAIAFGPGTLEGTTTRSTVAGAADFGDLVIHGGGTHLLRATAAGLLPLADSLVVAVAPISLALGAPLAIVDVGGSLTPPLEVRDSANVVVQGAQLVVTSGDEGLVHAAPDGSIAGVARGSAIVTYASYFASDKRDSLLAVAALPGAPIVIADLAGMTLRTDSLVDVVLYLDTRGGAHAGSAAVDVRWQPGVLAYQSHELVTGGVDAVVNADEAATGLVRLAFADPAGRDGRVPLLRIRFRAASTAAVGALSLGAAEISAADDAFTPLGQRATAVTHPIGVRP